ncbi:MAG TPA: hypothetical protein VM490_24725 [Armatimonadaceae bacterium]|jgi:hypothetical protein|nr:hypothetical protein [Armatimonadaceae bacterium]
MMAYAEPRPERQATSAPDLPAAEGAAVRDELNFREMERKGWPLVAAGYRVEVCEGRESLWVTLRSTEQRPGGNAGFALRTAWSPGSPLRVETCEDGDDFRAFAVRSSLGRMRVRVRVPDRDRPLVRCTVRLTPAGDLTLPQQHWPRDLYPVDGSGDPAGTSGGVRTAHCGPDAGLVYLAMQTPEPRSLLYVQNLGALHDYFRATGTRPEGVVGGKWPELGFQPPARGATPLPAGREVTVSDVVLCVADQTPTDESESARLFLDLLSEAYREIDRPAESAEDFCEEPRRRD